MSSTQSNGDVDKTQSTFRKPPLVPPRSTRNLSNENSISSQQNTSTPSPPVKGLSIGIRPLQSSSSQRENEEKNNINNTTKVVKFNNSTISENNHDNNNAPKEMKCGRILRFKFDSNQWEKEWVELDDCFAKFYTVDEKYEKNSNSVITFRVILEKSYIEPTVLTAETLQNELEKFCYFNLHFQTNLVQIGHLNEIELKEWKKEFTDLVEKCKIKRTSFTQSSRLNASNKLQPSAITSQIPTLSQNQMEKVMRRSGVASKLFAPTDRACELCNKTQIPTFLVSSQYLCLTCSTNKSKAQNSPTNENTSNSSTNTNTEKGPMKKKKKKFQFNLKKASINMSSAISSSNSSSSTSRKSKTSALFNPFKSRSLTDPPSTSSSPSSSQSNQRATLCPPSTSPQSSSTPLPTKTSPPVQSSENSSKNNNNNVIPPLINTPPPLPHREKPRGGSRTDLKSSFDKSFPKAMQKTDSTPLPKLPNDNPPNVLLKIPKRNTFLHLDDHFMNETTLDNKNNITNNNIEPPKLPPRTIPNKPKTLPRPPTSRPANPFQPPTVPINNNISGNGNNNSNSDNNTLSTEITNVNTTSNTTTSAARKKPPPPPAKDFNSLNKSNSDGKPAEIIEEKQTSPINTTKPKPPKVKKEEVEIIDTEDFKFSDDESDDKFGDSLYQMPAGYSDNKDDSEDNISDDDDDDSDDDDDDNEDDDDMGDWNSRFQSIMESMNDQLDSTENSRNLLLIGLATDFIYSATNYGKIIISELFLPDNKKTFLPIDIGGVAGGSKYKVRDILFKFALDTDGLYGTNDCYSAKVAGHDLKGLQAYFGCGLSEISLPFMALVDYLGFRLIAISLLPINKSTLVYGSNDGGNTIHNDDLHACATMKRAADILNIAEHKAGRIPDQRIKLYSAADIEGHKGTDHRFYLIDFSRTFPCQTPDMSIKGSNLFRLLRPEFVKSYPTPLCSDAYSSFCSTEYCKEIDESTKYLKTILIPKVSLEISKLFEQSGASLTSFRLTEILHSRGLNVRFLGLVLKEISNSIDYSEVKFDENDNNNDNNDNNDNNNDNTNDHNENNDDESKINSSKFCCISIILIEMCSRAIKNLLRSRLRTKMKKLKKPLEEPYRKLVLDFLNEVFGTSQKSIDYWEQRIKKNLFQSFEGFTEDSIPFSSNQSFKSKVISPVWKKYLYSKTEIDLRYVIILRLQKMFGLKFSSDAMKNFAISTKFDSPTPINRTDLDQIGERIKHMNIISHAEGYLLMLSGIQSRSTNKESSISSLQMAIEKFEEVLNSNQNNKITLLHCSRALLLLNEITRSGSKRNKQDQHIVRARQYLLHALQIDPSDPRTITQYAQFLQSCGEVGEAEKYFVNALEISPDDRDIKMAYGSFLEEQGDFQKAELYFSESIL